MEPSTIMSNLDTGPFGFLKILIVSLFYYLLAHIFILKPVYNGWFHPLSKFPGPKLWSVSHIRWAIMLLQGKAHKDTARLHREYGPVVRISPDELSFLQPEAWHEIMGHRKNHQLENLKAPYLTTNVDNIVTAGTEAHSRMRRLMSHGFAASTMLEQQPIIQGYVDLLIKRLHEKSGDGAGAGAGAEAIDMVAWFNYCTFDIIGDLAFGDPFGCLRDSALHPWVAMLFGSIKGATFLLAISQLFHGAKYLAPMLMTRKQMRDVEQHTQFTKEKLASRLSNTSPRPDFLYSMTGAKRPNGVSMTPAELQSNSETLILAGSETTATALSGATYCLAKSPDSLKKLAHEVRSSFKSEADIDLLSTAKLPYLNAVLKETLRVYPPATAALPRITPPKGTVVNGQAIPGNTIIGIPQWVMYHSPDNFLEPDSFIPERWLDDPRFASDRRDSLQPFGVGPRNCIGQNLANSEMRLILARFLWNFDYTLAEDAENWLDQRVYFLYEKRPLKVYLQPRQVKA